MGKIIKADRAETFQKEQEEFVGEGKFKKGKKQTNKKKDKYLKDLTRRVNSVITEVINFCGGKGRQSDLSYYEDSQVVSILCD